MLKRFKRVLLTTLVAASLLLALVPASTALAVVGTVAISQAAGAPGTFISLTSSGFTPSTTYSVVWTGAAGAATLAQGSTGTTGAFTAQFTVPAFSPRGTYAVTVTTTAPDTSNQLSFVVFPTVTLSQSTGGVGDQISVAGYGFTANSAVSIYFDTVAIATTTANAQGNASVSLTIPQSQRGTHSIRGVDAFGDSQIAAFSVVHKIAVNPTQAAVGAPLTLSGTGFGSSQALTVYFDEVAVATATTDSAGSFSLANFSMPESAFGAHTIRAQDATSNTVALTVNTVQSIRIDPTSGPTATNVSVTGAGFRPSEAVTITYDNVALTAGTVTTNAKGSFSATVTVPASSGGAHQIMAADAFNSDTKNFTVSGTATASPTSGFIGTRVSISGNGYLGSQTVSVLFDNSLAKTVTADAQGSFSTTFDIPAKAAGTYRIRITDGINIKDFDFAVTTSASITPQTTAGSPGAVGSPVTVSGEGFNAGAPLSVTYDGQQIAVGTVGNDSKFSITFNAPVSVAGQHTVAVTDGRISVPLTFFMEGNRPAAPTLIEPGAGERAKAETTLSWNAVNDPSGVTYVVQIASNPGFSQIVLEKSNLTTTEYTLSQAEKLQPTKKDTAYYWRVMAIDRASNQSNWSDGRPFTVGAPFPQWVIWLLVGLGALIIALFAFWMGSRRGGPNRPLTTAKLNEPGNIPQ